MERKTIQKVLWTSSVGNQRYIYDENLEAHNQELTRTILNKKYADIYSIQLQTKRWLEIILDNQNAFDIINYTIEVRKNKILTTLLEDEETNLSIVNEKNWEVVWKWNKLFKVFRFTKIID